jgi:multiple sugar transport system permease protein
MTVPKELEESAMIDGCDRIRAMVNIVIPIIMPGIAAIFIFAFVQSWNDLFSPLLFMTSDQRPPLYDSRRPERHDQ